MAAAFIIVAGSSKAGESPYNPGAQPAPPADYSYVCVAGNTGTFHTLYITEAHHATWAANDPTGIRRASTAWTQAIKNQPYPYNAHCMQDVTNHVQQLRQSLLAQPHDKTVAIDWQFGVAGPAAVSGSSMPPAAAAAPSVAGTAAEPSASSALSGAAQGFVNQGAAQMNGQANQAQQNLLNKMLGH